MVQDVMYVMVGDLDVRVGATLQSTLHCGAMLCVEVMQSTTVRNKKK